VCAPARQAAAGPPKAGAVLPPVREAGASAFDAPAARRAPRRTAAPERGSSAQQPVAGAVAAIRGAPLESCAGAAGRGAPPHAGAAADVVPEIVMQLRRAPLTAAVSLPVGDTLLPSPQELARALAAPPAPLLLAPVAAAASGPATASADDEPLYRRASVGASVSAREPPGQPGADGAGTPGSRPSSRDGSAGRAADLALPSARLQQQQQRAQEQRADPGIGARLRGPNGLHGGARQGAEAPRTRSHLARLQTTSRTAEDVHAQCARQGGCLRDRQAPCHSSGRRARRAVTPRSPPARPPSAAARARAARRRSGGRRRGGRARARAPAAPPPDAGRRRCRPLPQP